MGTDDLRHVDPALRHRVWRTLLFMVKSTLYWGSIIICVLTIYTIVIVGLWVVLTAGGTKVGYI